MSRSPEDRLARALDRVQSGGPAAVNGDDLEILELLETGGYLRENLTRVPAPEARRLAGPAAAGALVARADGPHPPAGP
jgi:hypothetical protein